jgi:hypothetical protein
MRGEGAEDERLRVLDHALKCDACRPELALLRSVSGEPVASESGSRMPLAWRRFVPVAAAASIAVVGLVVLQQVFNGPDVMRGGAAGAIALIAPANRATLTSDSTHFVWHPVPGAIRYTLEVTAPDGSVLASQETSDTAVVVKLSTASNADVRWWVKAAMDDGSEKRSDAREIRVR